MNIENIKKEFPLGILEAQKYVASKTGFAPEDVKQLTEHTIEHSPRWLYDFFDSKELLITVYVDKLMDAEFEINSGQEGAGIGFKTRTETEEAAFFRAFEELEKTLK